MISIIPVAILADMNFPSSGQNTAFFQLLLSKTKILFMKKANKTAMIHERTLASVIFSEKENPKRQSCFSKEKAVTRRVYDPQLTIVVITPQNRYAIISLYLRRSFLKLFFLSGRHYYTLYLLQSLFRKIKIQKNSCFAAFFLISGCFFLICGLLNVDKFPFFS